MKKNKSDNWYGDSCYYGIHHDLHVLEREANIGKNLSAKDLVETLELMKPDIIQTDSKGHEGVNSYRSKVPGSIFPPALKKEMVKEWRKAADVLGVPLHCHHSGLGDDHVAETHPDWAALEHKDGKFFRSKRYMCLRSGYSDNKLIPQLLELVNRYKVDGLWLDGEIWGVRLCYCDNCTRAFFEETGINEAPLRRDDPDWTAWLLFHKKSFEDYVTKYVAALKKNNPQTKVCSNWLYSFRNPGEPVVKTDWLSGDNAPVFGLINTRMEARFLSTRERTWELALWNFYPAVAGQPSLGTHSIGGGPWVCKSPQMLMQEAAQIVALGGNVMIYEQPKAVRDGRMVPWHMKRLGEVGDFIKKRRTLCQKSDAVYNAVVLHSEHHFFQKPTGDSLWAFDADPVRGAVFGLLNAGVSVDIMDEWKLFKHLDEIPLVVVPEQDKLSVECVERLKEYTKKGGSLLITGAEIMNRFESGFLGAEGNTVHYAPDNETPTCADSKAYHVAAGDGYVPVTGVKWREIKPTKAKEHGRLSTSLLAEDRTPFSSAVTHKTGKGKVTYVPGDIFKFYYLNRYPLMREFIRETIFKSTGKLMLKVKAPSAVDVILRKKKGKILVHLLNTLNGLPSTPRNGDVDEIPHCGPLTLELKCPRPQNVKSNFEKPEVKSSWEKGKLTLRIDKVELHACISVEIDKELTI